LENGGVKGFAGATYVENGDAVLEMECDILLPAALEAQITVENAPRIKAPLIAEAANGPLTFGGDEILRKRGVVRIPDIYLNAGGVTVSYFEWIKNISHIRFGRMERRVDEMRGALIIDLIEKMVGQKVPESIATQLKTGADELTLVRSGLDDTMRIGYQSLRKAYLDEEQIPDLRIAAFVCAIRKIARFYEEMGH